MCDKSNKNNTNKAMRQCLDSDCMSARSKINKYSNKNNNNNNKNGKNFNNNNNNINKNLQQQQKHIQHNTAWIYNLVTVALLIQHVVGVAQASELVSVAANMDTITTTTTVTATTTATATATTTTTKQSATTTTAAALATQAQTHSKSTPMSLTSMNLRAKRDVESVNYNTNYNNNDDNNKVYADIEFAQLATTRRLHGIDVSSVADGENSSSGSGSRMAEGVDHAVDFSAYMNDFNMQAEAAIPEDILDTQQHIPEDDDDDDDVDDNIDGIETDSMQYFSDSGGGNGGGGVVDEPEADIILAAKKFSSAKNSHYEDDEEAEEQKYDQHNSKQKKITRTEKLKNNTNNKNINNKSVDKNYDNDNTLAYIDPLDDMDDGHDVSDAASGTRSKLKKKTSALARNRKEQQNIPYNQKLITEGGENVGKVAGEDVMTEDEQQRQQFKQQHIEHLDEVGKFNKAPWQTEHHANKAASETVEYHNNNNNNNNNNNCNNDKTNSQRSRNSNNYGKNENYSDDEDEQDVVSAGKKLNYKNNNKEDSSEALIRKDNSSSKKVSNKSEMAYTDEVPIGDIEDKFHNEEEEQDEDENEQKAELDIKKQLQPQKNTLKTAQSSSEKKVARKSQKNNNDYVEYHEKDSKSGELGKSYEDEKQQVGMQQEEWATKFIPKKVKRHERAQGAKSGSSKAKEVDSNNNNNNNNNSSNNNNSYNNNRHMHKTRHHYGESLEQEPVQNQKLEQRNSANVNTYTQVDDAAELTLMPKNQQQQQQQQPIQKQKELQKLDAIIDGGESDGTAAATAVVGSKADYSITYFGSLTNSSRKREKLLLYEEDAEAEAAKKSAGERTAENSVKSADNVGKIADRADVTKVAGVHAAAQNKQKFGEQQQQQQQQQQNYAGALADAAAIKNHSTDVLPHHSAFEHYKAMRRKQRRYGHKMHKKKYKDYLRFATIGSTSVSASSPQTPGSGSWMAGDKETMKTGQVNATTILGPVETAARMVNANAEWKSNESNNSNNHTDYSHLRDDEEQQKHKQAGEKHAEKLRKYMRKIEEEKSRGLPPSPIFVVNNRLNGGRSASAEGLAGVHRSRDNDNGKPFYEGQINYYLETSDEGDDDDADGYGGLVSLHHHHQSGSAHERSMERLIAADNNNWYRRVSPMLRNGIKMANNEGTNKEPEAGGGMMGLIRQQKQRASVQAANHHRHRQRNHHHHHQQHQHQHQQQHKQHHAHQAYQQRSQHQHANRHVNHNNNNSNNKNNNNSNNNKHQQKKHSQQHDKLKAKQEQKQQQQQIEEEGKLPKTRPDGPPSPHAADTETAVQMGMVQTPLPPPSYIQQQQQQQQQRRKQTLDNDALQLGHQITELEDLERYYAKWPHLARVRFQVYDEHYREAHPELYAAQKGAVDGDGDGDDDGDGDGDGDNDDDGDDDEDADEDYDDDYESAAELEEAQSGNDEDANLPPYIKKYNRRNKQLLDLLEGTLAPPTRPPIAVLHGGLMRSWSSSGSVLQPGPRASSRSAGGGAGGVGRVRIDDDYLKEKRKRYHNRNFRLTTAGGNSGSSIGGQLSSAKSRNGQNEDGNATPDLFAEQRVNNANETRMRVAVTDGLNILQDTTRVQNRSATERQSGADTADITATAINSNHLPDEDVSISLDTDPYTNKDKDTNANIDTDMYRDRDTDTDIDAYAADDGSVSGWWPKEIENKSNANELTTSGSEKMTWQLEKLTTPHPFHAAAAPLSRSTPKALVFRLPAYAGIPGSFVGKPRSRSAQFAPSGGSRGGTLAFVAPPNGAPHNNRWNNIYSNSKGDGEREGGGAGTVFGSVGSGRNGFDSNNRQHKSLSRFSPYRTSVHKMLAANAGEIVGSQAPSGNSSNESRSDDGATKSEDSSLSAATVAATLTPPSEEGERAGEHETNAEAGRTLSSFVYHRVIDASPRLVGTGATGRKQRLPFVAITDRRLETTKKAQLERKKEFEQNHYPMP